LVNNVLILAALIAALYFGLLRGKSWEQSLDTLTYIVKVILGLGFLIFIHELGHFLAAKICNVRVEAFSIGFGPPIPGCHFKYGETEYKLALFPIGGYVKMPGEYPSETQEDEVKNDPRTFMNQTVGERMFIISAGVIMNMLFGFLAFIYVYYDGKTERAPYFGGIEPGSPAFVAGLRAGSELKQVQDMTNPSYDDLFFASALSSPGRTEIPLQWVTPNGQTQQASVISQRTKTDLRPVIGVGFPYGRRLFRFEEPDTSPSTPGSAAARVPFKGGDTLFTDWLPKPGAAALKIAFQGGAWFVDWLPKSALLALQSQLEFRPGDLFTGMRAKGETAFRPIKSGWDYKWAEHEYRGKWVEIEFDRKGKTMVLEVPPAFVYTFGLRMEMGEIVAVINQNAPPSASKFQKGDQLVAFNGNADFDPVRLPDLLTDKAAQASKGEKFTLTVLRNGQKVDISVDPTEFLTRGTWIETIASHPDTPLAIPALGIAYRVKPIIKGVEPDSPAARAGLKPGQVVKSVEMILETPQKPMLLDEENYQWPTVFWLLQMQPRAGRTWKFTVTDSQGQEKVVVLTAVEDRTWPMPDRGFHLENETRVRVAESMGEAIALGWKDTYQFVGRIYVNLYSLVRGDLSPKMLSGPIEMVRITYNVAGLSFTEFLHFLAIISINLAVVNFLPIPVLDGGHMVILIIEKIRGKPVSERLLVIVTITGLCIVLALMVFTIAIDITKFEWFQRLFG
jgi:regulator of sigma E protease